MLRLSRIIKAFQETGALNENVSIFGFLDDMFLTKAGDLGLVLRVEGVDYECLDSRDIDNLTKRLESALKLFDPKFRIYQWLFKTNCPALPNQSYADEVVQAAIDARLEHFRQDGIRDQRTVYDVRGKSYRLNELEARMIADIGKFRAIDKDDLRRHIYKEDQESLDRDLRHVHRQNLVRIVGPEGSLSKYIVLAKPAKELAEKYLRTNPRQEIYAGAVKIRELKHDAALYRLYQKAAQDIEKRGGRPLRPRS